MADRPKPDKTEKDEPSPDTSTAPSQPTISEDDPSVSHTIPPPSVGSGKSIPPQHPLANRGNRLAGRYELQDIVGEGGMGIVYRAHDLELDEEIAIKVLQRQFTQNPRDVERFKREIKTARRITHINIIRIHDFGIAEREAFISMELLTGGTLAERRERGPIDYEEALSIAIQVADGLGAAHRIGVIHRDIKPHNVLFDDKGVVKLVDFGIARFAAATQATHGLMGTPHYMSPEQADGREVTQESDVYSFGILMYELFTGALPFTSESLAKLAVMHVTQAPGSPRDVDSSIPKDLDTIILKCLSKDKTTRFKDGADVANALRKLARGEAVKIKLPAPRVESPPPEKRRRTWPLLLLALVAATVGAFLISQNMDTVNEILGRVTPTAIVANTPAPTPTVASQITVTVTATAKPTPKRTAKPTPRRTQRVRRTPKPTRRAATPTPTAREVVVTVTATPPVGPAAGPGRVIVTLIPYGKVAVFTLDDNQNAMTEDADGNKLNRSVSKQQHKLRLNPGKYVIVGTTAEYKKMVKPVTVKSGYDAKLKFNFPKDSKPKPKKQ